MTLQPYRIIENRFALEPAFRRAEVVVTPKFGDDVFRYALCRGSIPLLDKLSLAVQFAIGPQPSRLERCSILPPIGIGHPSQNLSPGGHRFEIRRQQFRLGLRPNKRQGSSHPIELQPVKIVADDSSKDVFEITLVAIVLVRRHRQLAAVANTQAKAQSFEKSAVVEMRI